jgi:uncharacterized integral membrane protein (TIGR00698 family)
MSNGERVNPYTNPELSRWLDSAEGLPDVGDVHESPAEQRARGGLRSRLHAAFANAGKYLPGVALAASVAVLGHASAAWIGVLVLGFEKSPLSTVGVAVVLGLAIRNAIGLPAIYDEGLRLCVRTLLRVGVALLGLRLSLGAAGAIGLQALPIVIVTIAFALLAVTAFARALRLPSRLGLLIAVGTGICGNTAIVAVGPVIGAKEDETTYAVACVTLFGMLALLFYPPLAHALFAGDPEQVGFFLGTAIHDTAQVAGAGLLYSLQYAAPQSLDVATVTKLVRNLFLLVVIPLAALISRSGDGARRKAKTPFSQLVPGFVFAFFALTLLRTLGDASERPFGVLSPGAWSALLASADFVSSWLLAFAMAAVGLGTSVVKLRVLGARPFAVGIAAALAVGAVSYAAIRTWV